MRRRKNSIEWRRKRRLNVNITRQWVSIVIMAPYTNTIEVQRCIITYWCWSYNLLCLEMTRGDLGCMDCRGGQLEARIHEISKLEFHSIKGFMLNLKDWGIWDLGEDNLKNRIDGTVNLSFEYHDIIIFRNLKRSRNFHLDFTTSRARKLNIASPIRKISDVAWLVWAVKSILKFSNPKKHLF